MDIEKRIEEMVQTERRMKERLKKLEEKTWVGKDKNYPVPVIAWKEGKYLVLWFSLPEGRKSVYIGCDPFYVSEALEGVRVQKEIIKIRAWLHGVYQVRNRLEIEISNWQQDILNIV